MSEHPLRFEKHIPVPLPNTMAVDLIAEHCQLSKQQVKNVMLKGAVWCSKGKKTQRLRRAKRILNPNETIHVYYDKHVIDQQPIPAQLIQDMKLFSVWNKPHGMFSQGTKWGDHCALTRFSEQYFQPNRPSFLVHRLDQDACGLIVIAHQSKAAAALSGLFQGRTIEKRYQIWVEGNFALLLKEKTILTHDSDIEGKQAVSHFKLLSYDADRDRSLLDVSIETGRKHQIRRHAAELGYPVVGDRLYGVIQSTEPLQLMAYYLAFKCPLTGQELVFNLLES